MSRTELYKIKMNGDVVLHEEFQNSHLGAHLIWRNMGERYLGDPFYISNAQNKSWYPDHDPKKFWNLVGQQNIPVEERIVLASTYDLTCVKWNNIPRLIDAFRYYASSYSDTGHALAYVDVLRDLLNDRDCIGICWNQTSICADIWCGVCDHDENGEVIPDTYRPFNIFTDTHSWFKNECHWWLFEGDYIDHPTMNDIPPSRMQEDENAIIKRLSR